MSVDTWRADHVGPLADDDRLTPAFDRLAETGTFFERALAPIAVTGPSHAAMLTGVGPWRTQMLLNGVGIPKDHLLLSQQLSDEGYRTGAFVSAYVLDGQLGFQRGFEVYDDEFAAVRGWSRTGPGRIHAMLERHLSPSHIVERRGDKTIDRALDWLSQDSSRPTFSWIHLFDPHGPYVPPKPFDEMYYSGDPRALEHHSMEGVSDVAEYLKPSLEGIRDLDWVRAQYAGEVSFVDQQMGRVIQHLESKGTLADTLVIIVGDHGESFGENGVWFNHGGDLDESALHVPFLVHWPKVVKEGRRISNTVGVIDLAPTVLGLLSIDKMQTDGTDRSAELRGLAPMAQVPVQSICYDRTVNQAERAREAQERQRQRAAMDAAKDAGAQLLLFFTRRKVQCFFVGSGSCESGSVASEATCNLTS